MDKETFRKYLIKNASPAELKMLEALRFDEELNNKFEFQKIFHPYIVDFYFKYINLAVELDGRSHKNKEKYDDERTMYLKRVHRVNIIRFENKIVFNSPHVIMAKIKTFVHEPFKKKKTKYSKYDKKNKFGIGGWYRIY